MTEVQMANTWTTEGLAASQAVLEGLVLLLFAQVPDQQKVLESFKEITDGTSTLLLYSDQSDEFHARFQDMAAFMLKSMENVSRRRRE
jgi:hypothetical protein